MKLKEISKNNRPRERLYNFGPQSLSDAELLAIILCTGNKNENVIDLSNRILSEVKDLVNIGINELMDIKGIGLAKACKITALFELSRRCSVKKIKKIGNSGDAAQLFIPRLKDEKKEHIYLLMLDNMNNIIKTELVGVGILDSCLIHPREVFNQAIRNNAASIILAHNHPSGNLKPSDDDLKITDIMRKTGDIIGIKLLDHIIIAGESWKSVS